MTQPLRFSVSDMLRGKCLFLDVTQINDACAAIKVNADAIKARIVEIDNRLESDKGTSDLVLKILIGGSVAELQLAFNSDNLAAYEFSHKIYELLRSPFFSPLTMLKRFNQ